MATLTVTAATDAGPGSLRAAIAAAASGDTVTFAPSLAGTKITLTSGPLSITRDLKIVGPTGPNLTNISGGGRSTVFLIQPSTLSVSSPPINVSIVGLEIADGAASNGGGGIDATQVNLTLANDAVINNQFQQGDRRGTGAGGVSLMPGSYGTTTPGAQIVAGSLSVYGTTFRGNGGGALSLHETPALIVTSAFTDNGSGTGGAISDIRQFNTAATLTVVGTRFTGNRADSPAVASGGAIDIGSVPTTVTGSWFGGNVADGVTGGAGGAIFGSSGSILVIRGSTFVANRAESTAMGYSASGGAVAGDPATSLTIDGSTFLGNVSRATQLAYGGAVRNYGESDFSIKDPFGTTITNSTFSGNQAVGISPENIDRPESSEGGGVSIDAGFVVISNVHFLGNQSIGSSGGVNGRGGIGEGGGLWVGFEDGTVTVNNSLFSGNLAQGGTGSQTSNSSDAGYGYFGSALGGGIISFGAGRSTISDTQFVANSAIGGAGTGASSPGSLAGGGGLDWEANGPLALTNVTATGNSAVGGAGGTAGPMAGSQGGPGGLALGGGVNIGGLKVTITGGRFASNTARGGDSPGGVAGDAKGGGVFDDGVDNPLNLTLTDAVLSSNMAIGGSGLSGGDGQGGGLYVAIYDFLVGLVVNITNDAISGNQAQGGSAGQGLGGGTYLTAGTQATIDKASRIAGNTASTSGNDLYTA